jgi:hypothetical protein
MDEEGLGAVALLDVALGNTGLEVENGIRVEAEDITDAWVL